MVQCTCDQCGKGFEKTRRRGSLVVCPSCQNKARIKKWKDLHPERETNQPSLAVKERYAKSEKGRVAARAKSKRFFLKMNQNPEWRRLNLDKSGARRYGITVEQYTTLRSRPCSICGTLEAKGRPGIGMFIDHDHETGRVRGALCYPCNTGLGVFKDNIGIIASAIRYLSPEVNTDVNSAH